MEELKKTVAENIIRLRTNAKLTQAELGEKLNYSDKSVSKWERAESLPDAFVLKSMAELFNVSVDYILGSHTEDEEIEVKNPIKKSNHKIISLIAIFGVWAAVLIAFVTTWITLGKVYWLLFVYAIPVTFLLLLIFNSIWSKYKMAKNVVCLSVMLWGLILSLYLSFLPYTFWQLFLIGVPCQVIIILCAFVKRRKPR